MASSTSQKPKASYVPIAIGAVALVLLLGAFLYLNHGRPSGVSEEQASQEAKAYVRNLELADVTMQAAENFMQQQVVEVAGKITNRGNRPLESIDVYCLFYNVNGSVIHRERVPVVRSKGQPLAPGETRSFRLPFDSLPAAWNQAMPHLVVAQIRFSQ
jgi:hypothetical protein